MKIRHIRLFLLTAPLLAAAIIGAGIGELEARPKKKKAHAPTRTELQKQKRAAQTEIRQAQGQIRSNEGEIAANLRKVQVLETQIDDTHKSLDSLAAVSRRLSDTGVKLQSDIAGNQTELARLRAAYLKEIKQMRLHRAQTTGMAFLFSAKNFHQGLARMRYMRRIAEWRRSRTDAIGDQLTLLETQNRQLAVTRRAQDATVAETRNRQSRLGSDKQQLESLSARLRSDNQGLQSLIAKKRSEITSLDRKTAALIAQAQAAAEARRRAEAQRQAAQKRAEEQRLAAERRAEQERQIHEQRADQSHRTSQTSPTSKPAPSIASTSASSSPYAEARRRRPRASAPVQKPHEEKPAKTTTATSTPASGFASAKGSLPRPVRGSFRIVIPYGRHSRPDMPKVQLDNTGIDAEVNSGAAVQAVYDGQVAAVYRAQGFGTVVLLRHGEYYTVYANLGSCSVSTGQKLKQGQTLGTVASGGDLAPTIHFEVWKQRTRLNPSEWLR